MGAVAGRVAVVALLAVLAIGVLASGAAGQGVSHRSDQVVLTGSLDVPAGETVDTAVIFNGPATIEGTVTGSLVVFNGRTEVTGSVAHDVVVFNGSVTIRSGAVVGGNLYSRETATIEQGATVQGRVGGVATRFDLKRLGFGGRVVWWIGFSVSTLLLGLILLAFAPSLDGALLEGARTRIAAGFGFGAAVFFLLPLAAIVFLAVIVAIPLGVFLLLGLALLYTVGYVAGAHGVGRLLVRPPTSRFAAFLAGWAILRGLALIPAVGGVVFVLASVLGLGLLVVAARRRPRVDAAAIVPPPPPAA